MAKRILDLVLSIIGILISLPLWCTIIIVLYFQNETKIFYYQERVGKEGKLFIVIKFRTMENEKVTSRFCRFLRNTALDELPQLISILKGDMSFVGPRPLIKEELSNKEMMEARTKVVPGLTGVSQVLLYKGALVEEKTKLDYWYINNRCFFLDMKIILISFVITFLRRWESKDKKIVIERIKRIIFTNEK